MYINTCNTILIFDSDTKANVHGTGMFSMLENCIGLYYLLFSLIRWQTKNAILSEQFELRSQNHIEEKGKLDTLTHCIPTV